MFCFSQNFIAKWISVKINQIFMIKLHFSSKIRSFLPRTYYFAFIQTQLKWVNVFFQSLHHHFPNWQTQLWIKCIQVRIWTFTAEKKSEMHCKAKESKKKRKISNDFHCSRQVDTLTCNNHFNQLTTATATTTTSTQMSQREKRERTQNKTITVIITRFIADWCCNREWEHKQWKKNKQQTRRVINYMWMCIALHCSSAFHPQYQRLISGLKRRQQKRKKKRNDKK